MGSDWSWVHDIDGLRAERDRRKVEPMAYAVPGGRGFVELLGMDGDRVLALDGLHKPFIIIPDAFNVLATDEKSARIVRRFVASWQLSELGGGK